MPTEDMDGPGHQEARPRRDPRFDVGRGAALWIIFSDHISGNIVKQFTPVSLGFSDMAEVFVFLSGYVGGVASRGRIRREGTWGGFRRAFIRMGQIYLAMVLTLIVLDLTSAWLGAWFPNLLVRGAHREAVPDSLGAWLLDVVLLRELASEAAVLTLYFWFSLLLPAAVWLATRRPGLLALASFAFYVSAQLFPDSMAPPGLWGGAWYFNPFAWQMVFLSGVLLSVSRDLRARLPRGRSAVVASVLVLEGAFLARLFLSKDFIPLTGKANLEALRVLHFGALLIVARVLMRPSTPLWESRWLKPLVLCGRNSLMVFCVGVILAAVATTFLDSVGYAMLGQVVANLSGWLLLTTTAALWTVAKRVMR
ncbi:OpgC family protein [Singulisphaera acidiphila]|uniref:OpgC protein n=1 Tax=Singulisphaera acidiphila (strain ATCC BAA-1392 / DSM 18658 / VKM B-2454 / MOB10) TaxID=886293 RepID=L0DK70_SINAD|nr:OpgC domain-containing protein [Singulisphaera acidiphila]AGA29046.1 hypothetical protein Sinac_4888 [Singulisphaera acidiphila DSM 18658]